MRAETLEIAGRLRPGALASDIVAIGRGQLSTAFRVRDIVLRFPHSEFARDRLRDEVRVLQQIRPHLRHELPEIVAAEFHASLRRSFVAHHFLRGSIITPAAVDRLPADKLGALATQTASFLRDLHSMQTNGLDIPTRSNRDFARALMNEARDMLRPRVFRAQWDRIESELEALSRIQTDRLCVCHTDIGGNVLYDEPTGRVAFIDFGSTMLADPVLDYASLSVLGLGFTTQCAETYPAIGERMSDVNTVRVTFHLQDALYGARQGDWEYVDDVLSSY